MLIKYDTNPVQNQKQPYQKHTRSFNQHTFYVSNNKHNTPQIFQQGMIYPLIVNQLK